MKILSLLSLCMFFTLNLYARSLDKVFQLLPQPQSVEVLAGKGFMYDELTFVSVEIGRAHV